MEILRCDSCGKEVGEIKSGKDVGLKSTGQVFYDFVRLTSSCGEFYDLCLDCEKEFKENQLSFRKGYNRDVQLTS
jgi:DNA-directed RNA polymerase subunit RPC12/RpoP